MNSAFFPLLSLIAQAATLPPSRAMRRAGKAKRRQRAWRTWLVEARAARAGR